jgi:molybdate transport system substrate-binding protein
MIKSICVLGFIAWSFLSSIAYGQSVTVAVASNLKPAFEEIFKGFQQSNPQSKNIRVVYGSSGNLSSQMRHGAPYELFISADEAYPLKLVEAGLTRDRGVVYASGHLALINNAATGLRLSSDPDSIQSLLRSAKKIAIANPDLAPYGRASVQYLQVIGLWDELQSGVIFAENISIAAVYVSTGAAKVGITALSLAKSIALYDYLQGSVARQILRNNGYSVP